MKSNKFVLGFTLVELLIVISIFGILMTVILGNLQTSKSKARDNARISDVRTLQLSLELYYDKNRHYPTSLDDLLGEFISDIPVPAPGTSASAYIYTGIGTSKCSSYHLAAVMENETSKYLDSDLDLAPRTVCPGGGSDFHGFSEQCTGSSAGLVDKCFDVKDEKL